MPEKTIHYTDLDGKPAEATYYFALNTADLAEMKLSHKGDITEHFARIIEENDGAKLVAWYKDLLFKSIGRREGMRLVKNQDIVDEFVQTGAYEALFMNLLASEDAGNEFFISILPPALVEEAKKQDEAPVVKFYTDEEFDLTSELDPQRMTKEQLLAAFQRKTRAA